jgi:hypothetical protein
VVFTWSAADPGAVTGYSYKLSTWWTRYESDAPDEESEGTATLYSYDAWTGDAMGAEGECTFAVRARDAAGTWGRPAAIHVKIGCVVPDVRQWNLGDIISAPTTWVWETR